MKTRLFMTLTMFGGYCILAVKGQVVDFETLPDGSRPIEGMEISTQYESAFHVSFALQSGRLPRLAKRDSANFVAFDGANSIPNHPAANQNVGNFFLTGHKGKTAGPTPLIISFSSSVAAASGVILDVDGNESWEITARDHQGYNIATTNLHVGSPNAGNGTAAPWTFSRPTADIASIRMASVGPRGAVGWALDNLVIGWPVAPGKASVSVANGRLQIGVAGTFGAAYRVEYAESLASANWRLLSNVTLSSAPEQTLMDTPTPDVTTRFYRVIGTP